MPILCSIVVINFVMDAPNSSFCLFFTVCVSETKTILRANYLILPANIQVDFLYLHNDLLTNVVM